MSIQVRKCSPVIGAEIVAADLSQPMSRETFDEIHHTWLEHNIILFRGQDLAPEQQIAFSRNFGKIELHTLSAYHMPGHPEIFINSNVLEDGKPIGAQKIWTHLAQRLAVSTTAKLSDYPACAGSAGRTR